ncbi:hypothetical protein JWV37_11560 [Sulfurospirillum sp. T05]|uniref:Phage abortive infection protein n=1 Tax=Sulfurospirillum tamanense TaxID=2813362 RepID=A0ABS2WUY1_9BACT|nr:hypothetical protein [Sulfurospirillum tamanensis]MBN2965420.1 hypothetical protein [Sulfurospirillum tamanensis]
MAKEKINELTSDYKSYNRAVNVLFFIACFMVLVLLFLKLFPEESISKIFAPLVDSGLISPFFIAISALLASSSVMKSITSSQLLHEENKIVDKSKFYLEKSLEELKNIHSLLQDKNNNKVTWILASRVIKLTEELANKITEEHHKKVFNLQKYQIQHKLREAFKWKENDGFPLSFYAGLKNWETCRDSDALAEIKNVIINNQLNEESIIVIFDFLKFPDNYTDPLDDVKAPRTDEEIEEWRRNGGISNINTCAWIYLKNKAKSVS